jgi:glucan phosphorylase
MAGGVALAGAGATFPAPLYKRWIIDFGDVRKDISIKYEPVGSGEGIKRFLEGSVDFGASDAAMSDKDLALLKRLIKDHPELASKIDMTKIAMIFSSYDNAVSLQHKKTSRHIFKGFGLEAITNGVDSDFWTSYDFASLYDQHISNWRADNSLLKKAKSIPLVDIEKTHNETKKKMIEFLNSNYSCNLKENIFTIVFARRFAPYKRPSLILSDLTKLLEINKNSWTKGSHGTAHHEVCGVSFLRHRE